MPILRSRQHVGQDILLARHGNRICSTRYDRRRNCVVARLDDGTFDSAPNLIVAAPEQATLASVLVEEGPFLARACVLYVLFALVLTGAMAALAWASNDLTAASVANAYLAPYQIPVR
jgi:hypothetical protein